MSKIRMVPSGDQYIDNYNGDVMIIKDPFRGHWMICHRQYKIRTRTFAWVSSNKRYPTAAAAIQFANSLLEDRERARQAMRAAS